VVDLGELDPEKRPPTIEIIRTQAASALARSGQILYLHCRYRGIMKTQIQKWGNSLALRIPKAFASDLGLDRESSVELTIEDGRLVIKPAAEVKYELTELVSRVTEANIHGEQDYGDATGGEEW
jgi:antitoxin MazE